MSEPSPGIYTEILYGPVGGKALLNAQTAVKVFPPLPAGATAVYNSSGLSYYRHPDWLGSSRLASTPSQTLYQPVSAGLRTGRAFKPKLLSCINRCVPDVSILRD